jgi:pyruvate kinase
MSDKDRQDLEWGIKNDIDYIAASFVRRAQDVDEIRTFSSGLVDQHMPGTPYPLIISKIESTEALDNFAEILEASDGIMVARGDLGVEIPTEDLTMVQKAIIKACNEAGKPVIVATQMLESMQKNPRPTRAECTDVANAIFDGADCVMLSGESAQGK